MESSLWAQWEMATHSSIRAWKISWTEEPGGLQSKGLQRVGHSWATKHTFSKWKGDSLSGISSLHCFYSASSKEDSLKEIQNVGGWIWSLGVHFFPFVSSGSFACIFIKKWKWEWFLNAVSDYQLHVWHWTSDLENISLSSISV